MPVSSITPVTTSGVCGVTANLAATPALSVVTAADYITETMRQYVLDWLRTQAVTILLVDQMAGLALALRLGERPGAFIRVRDDKGQAVVRTGVATALLAWLAAGLAVGWAFLGRLEHEQDGAAQRLAAFGQQLRGARAEPARGGDHRGAGGGHGAPCGRTNLQGQRL